MVAFDEMKKFSMKRRLKNNFVLVHFVVKHELFKSFSKIVGHVHYLKLAPHANSEAATVGVL